MKQTIEAQAASTAGVEQKEKIKFPEFESLQKLSGQHRAIFDDAMRTTKKENELFMESKEGKRSAGLVSSKLLKNFGTMTEQVSKWNSAFSESGRNPREVAPEIANDFSEKLSAWIKQPKERNAALVKAGVYDKFDLKGVDSDGRDKIVEYVGGDQFRKLVDMQLSGEFSPGVTGSEEEKIEKIADRMHKGAKEFLEGKYVTGIREAEAAGRESEVPVEGVEKRPEWKAPKEASPEDLEAIQEMTEKEKMLKQELIENPKQMAEFFKASRRELYGLIKTVILADCNEKLDYKDSKDFNKKWSEISRTYVNNHWGKGFTIDDVNELVLGLKEADEKKSGIQTGQLSMFDVERIANLIYEKQEEQMEKEIPEIIEEINRREKNE
ncbi:hypothetical protein ACFL2R_01135 [Patescibacteria group bacterium]